MEVLFKGIYNKLSGSALDTSIGGRLYLGVPQGATFPYVRYGLISNITSDTFTEYGEDYSLQFDLFSNEFSASEVCTIYENWKTLYSHTALTITGYTHIDSWRGLSYLMRDEGNNIWHYACELDVMMEKSR